MYRNGYRSNKYLEQVRPDVHLKQKWFLQMEQLEIMYGGAAGGGKSDALLMAALQYVDIPRYAALILRKTYQDLAKSGALMDRAASWLTKTGAIKRDGGKKWEFPGGGVLEFGYCDHPNDVYNFQSAEYQFIAWDEVTQVPQDSYRYLFSRCRRPSDSKCIDCNGKGKVGRHRCPFCFGTGSNPLSQVPLRIRSATNPGGKYGEWVRKDFVPRQYMQAPEDVQFSRIWAKRGKCGLCSGKGKVEVRGKLEDCSPCKGTGKTIRYFVPARLEDNPSVDMQAYEEALLNLPPEERAKLRHGRWDIVSDGTLFKSNWFRRYQFRGENLWLHTSLGQKIIDSADWHTFLTADTASTIKSTSDYTVICVWIYIPKTNEICLVHVHRERMLVPHIVPTIERIYEEYGCYAAIIEQAASGIGVVQEIQLGERGGRLNVIPFSPHTGDKVSRSTEAQIMAESGKIYIPMKEEFDNDDTLMEWFNEILQFDGDEGSAHDDCVDNISMAAWWAMEKYRSRQSASGYGPGQMVLEGLNFARYNRF